MKTRFLAIATALLLGSPIVCFASESSPPIQRSTDAAPSDQYIIAAARGGGHRAGGAHRGGASVNRNVNRSNAGNRNVNRSNAGNRNYNRSNAGNRNYNRNYNGNVNRSSYRNVNVNRNVNVHGRYGYGVYRPWVSRPYFGTVVAGVALGTLIAVTAVPTSPSSELCWYWSDSSNTQGYWDYCEPR